MFENIRLAFQGIWSHKMRSFLTMLGIIIGIASIIAIVSTIKGTSEQIKEELIGSGNHTVNVFLYEGDSEYSAEYAMSSTSYRPLLTEEIKEKVRAVEHVENATFYYSRSSTMAYLGSVALTGGTTLGVDSEYLDTCGYTIQAGRGLIPSDYTGIRKVCVLDTNAASYLSPGDNPVGKIIEIGSEPFTVVGIASKENYRLTMESPDDYWEYYNLVMGTIMVPETCWPILYKFDETQNCIVRADSTDNMSVAGNGAARVLNTVINPEKKSEYGSSFQYKAEDILKTVQEQQKLAESTSQQLIWIAAISLLVGGIGVMNIMLVSVTERTSEIGLKKAIGAKKRTIQMQFLTEAAVLTSLGGVIGVVLGIALSELVSRVAGSPTAISIPAIIVSVVFSTLIGVIFGLLPSVKAANLNPIQALRSE